MPIASSAPGSSAPAATSVALDPSQRAVLALPPGASAVVLGAPGTGKTTTLVELAADRVARGLVAPDELLVLAPARAQATRLRDRLSIRLGVPTQGPLVRTATSQAFQLLAGAAAAAGGIRPSLITGGEQDRLIGELLQGHLDEGGGPDWPEQLSPEVRVLAGFRSELRELFARVFELRLDPVGLAALGRSAARPEWVAAGEFLAEYLEVAAQAQPGALTAAELLRDAATALDSDPALAPGSPLVRHRLILVDDVQEFTRGAFELLSMYARRGVAVVGFGDPDAATTTFRGADPSSVARFRELLRLTPEPPLVLGVAHRQPAELRAATARVTARIGAALAGRQRSAAPASVSASEPELKSESESGSAGAGAGAGAGVAAVPGGAETTSPVDGSRVLRIVEGSSAEQYGAIARLLREQHIVGGRSWSSMAVVVRSGAQLPSVVRALAVAEVPTRTLVSGRALRDDYAAAQLILAARIALGLVPLDGITAAELLLGPLGGLDAVTLRRLRLALRHEELAGGGIRSADELLAEAIAEPGRLVTIDSGIARRAARLAASLATARADGVNGATIEELLWGLWERSGLSDVWLEQSRRGGILAEEADRNLDGVVALFTSAKRFVERGDGRSASDYLEDLVSAAVPEDTLAPQSIAESVLVATPPGVAGLEFDVVVVAALQEGVWPNIRLRGGLLHPHELAAAAGGVVPGRGVPTAHAGGAGGLGGVGSTAADAANPSFDERKAVLDDELRMLAVAVGRARRLLVLAATSNEDEQPSPFAGLVPGQPWSGPRHPLTLRGLVGELRRIAAVDEQRRPVAAAALARLAAEGVGGADPQEWYGVLDPSTSEPLVDLDDPEARVSVSPSQIDGFEASPLGWFVSTMSGSSGGLATGLGTILHTIMENASQDEDISVERIAADIDRRWGELGLEEGWQERREHGRAMKMAQALHDYLVDFRSSGGELVSAEGGFELGFGQIVITGKIDRVERTAEGRVVIVDLKTGRTAPTKAQLPEHAQLAAYQFAFRAGGLDPVFAEHGLTASPEELGGAKLVYVAPDHETKKRRYREVLQDAQDDDAAAVFWSRVEDVGAGMAGASFPGVRGGEHDGGLAGYDYRIHLVPEVSA